MGYDEETVQEWLKNPDLKVEDDAVVPKQVKQHKYRAQRTVYNGRSYPSKKQADYAALLDFEKKQDGIKGYLEEVRFRLPGNTYHRVDFGIIQNDGTMLWVEVKGYETRLGRIKRQQVEELYKIKVKVV